MRRSPRLSLETLAPYLLEVATPSSGELPLLDWPTIFGNDKPVEIEVGSGKGLFLLTAALRHPDTNFLGIEIVRKYQLFTATRMAKRELRNVRMSCTDARLLLRDRIAASSVQAVHVYFPDPWWKKRHHKRRVFTAEFVASVARILQPGGSLFVATDVEEYFRIMRDLIETQPNLRVKQFAESETGVDDTDYFTNFERKARLKGKIVYRLIAERI